MPEDNYYFDKLFKKRKKFNFYKDKEILDLINKNLQKGKVLDLGVGESGNFIELCKKGFDVTVIDISKKIIEEIKKVAKKENISVKAISKDVKKLAFHEKYDIILCIALLHFLTKEESYKLIKKMKRYTNNNGLNIIIAFREGDKKQSEKNSFYVKSQELRSLYSNWKVLNYEDYEDEDGKLSLIVAKK